MDSRMLTAIMFTDVTGSSAIMGRNEQHGMEMLRKQRETVEKCVSEHKGRIVKWMGDGSLSLFPSAVEAVTCAIAIQDRIRLDNLSYPEKDRFFLRIGVHWGDVAMKDGDAFGNDVNIAARIEPMAPPGGICISRDVYNRIKGRIEVQTISIGEQQLKNIEDTLELYQVLVHSMRQEAPAQTPKMTKEARDAAIRDAFAALPKREARKKRIPYLRYAFFAAVVLVAVWWYLYGPPFSEVMSWFKTQDWWIELASRLIALRERPL